MSYADGVEDLMMLDIFPWRMMVGREQDKAEYSQEQARKWCGIVSEFRFWWMV